MTSQYLAGFSSTGFTIPQTQPIPRPQSTAWSMGSIPETTRLPLFGQPLLQGSPAYRPPVPKPQMVNPGSCWGPPPSRPQFGNMYQEPKHSRVKLEPPHFDGLETNNCIRSVHYYFDHIGTPVEQRLHYVIPLFDPPVADWIWSYCASHESATWFEFLDDVRRQFDPTCYQSHIGLLSKLTQTGTIAEYQPLSKLCRIRLLPRSCATGVIYCRLATTAAGRGPAPPTVVPGIGVCPG